MERIEFYTDYRSYLRDLSADLKKRKKAFSARYFCNKSGLKSPSLFKEVMDGKRNMTPATIKAFIKGLGLNQNDGAFFNLLVKFNQAKEPEEKQRHLDDMRKLRRQVKQILTPIDQYDLYTDWYYLAIRELACIMDWKNDYRLLAKSISPPIKMSQARTCVETLLRLGQIRRKNNSGKYEQTHPAITTGSEVISLGVRKLNKKLSVLGTEAIDRYPTSERDITSLVVGISEKSYGLIKEELREVRRRVIRIADDDQDANTAYNINLQFFPLSLGPTEENRPS